MQYRSRNSQRMQLLVFFINFFIVLIAPLAQSACDCTCDCSSKAELPILAFIPWKNSLWPEGTACLPAACKAIEDINNSTEYLRDYCLSLRYSLSSDNGCTSAEAVKYYMKDKSLNETKPVAIFGPGCSAAALKIASLASQPGDEIVQVSYGATNPILSNAKSYPYFFRTVPSQLELTAALRKFVERGNWTRVFAFFQGSSSILRNTALNFVSALPKSVRKPLLSHLQGSSKPDIESVLNAIKSVNYVPIIIFAFVGHELITDILDSAHELDMSAREYVWVFPEQYRNWTTDWKACSKRSNNWPLIFQTQYQIYQANLTARLPSGKTVNQTLSRLKEKIDTFAGKYNVSDNFTGDSFTYAAYDAMWAIAIGLHHTEIKLNESGLSLRDCTRHQSNVSEILQNVFRHNVSFEGLSGRVTFQSSHNDSKARVLLQRVRADCSFQEAFVFFDGSLQVIHPLAEFPVDDFVLESYNISPVSFVVVLLLAGLALVVTTVFAGINIVCRKQRVVRSTSPQINLFIFSAHYMLIVFVVILSVIHYFPDVLKKMCGAVSCNFLVWLLSLGVSLIITPLFVKYFRLYLIFSARYKISIHTKFNDCVLSLVIIGVVLVADVIPLVVLIGKSPLLFEESLPITEQGKRTQIIQCSLSLNGDCAIVLNGLSVAWLLLCKLVVAGLLLLATFALRNITVHRDLFNDSGSVFLFMIVGSLSFIACSLIFFIPYLSLTAAFSIRYYVLVCAVIVLLFSSNIQFFFKYRTIFFLRTFHKLLKRKRLRQDSSVFPEVYVNQTYSRQRFSSFAQGVSPTSEIPQGRNRASLLSLPLSSRRASNSKSSPSSPAGVGLYAASAWYARNRPRTSSFSTSSSPFPHLQRDSVNSVHFSPTPPEVAFFLPDSSSRFQRRLSSIASVSSDTSKLELYSPYYS